MMLMTITYDLWVKLVIVHGNHSRDPHELSSRLESHLSRLIQYIGNIAWITQPRAYLTCDLYKGTSCSMSLFFDTGTEIASSAEVLWTEEVEKTVCKSGVPREDLYGVSTESLDRIEWLDGEKLIVAVRPRDALEGEVTVLTSIMIALGLGRGA